jgi:hypothetical protein
MVQLVTKGQKGQPVFKGQWGQLEWKVQQELKVEQEHKAIWVYMEKEPLPWYQIY